MKGYVLEYSLPIPSVSAVFSGVELSNVNYCLQIIEVTVRRFGFLKPEYLHECCNHLQAEELLFNRFFPIDYSALKHYL